jgi:hypothetical protein
MADKIPDIAALARANAPDALKALIEVMRTGPASARTEAAKILKARLAIARQILPAEADAIAAEVDEILKKRG